MKEGFGALHPPPCLTDHAEMSLLRSFSTRAAHETLNMALPGELFAPGPPSYEWYSRDAAPPAILQMDGLFNQL